MVEEAEWNSANLISVDFQGILVSVAPRLLVLSYVTLWKTQLH